MIRENDRVLACVNALEREDLDAVGDLLAASHASLRDLFEVSSPELDALVAIATSTPVLRSSTISSVVACRPGA